jgi:hypothetical protein
MKHRYIVFYQTSNGTGSTSVKTNRNERLNKIENIRKIEHELSKEFNNNVSVTNIISAGMTWK